MKEKTPIVETIPVKEKKASLSKKHRKKIIFKLLCSQRALTFIQQHRECYPDQVYRNFLMDLEETQIKIFSKILINNKFKSS